MREAPGHVVKALRGYDRELGLRWDGRLRCWMVTYRDADAWRYEHGDGTVAINDVSADELLRQCRAYDNQVHGSLRIRALEASRRRRLDRQAEESRREMEAASREAGGAANFWRRGKVKPFISGFGSSKVALTTG